MSVNLQKAENYWIEACRATDWQGYAAFAYFVFGFKPEPFHIDWLEGYASETELNWVNVAPRGSAKTTYLCIALLKYIADHPWDANALLSVSATQAKERLAFIRNTFNSERFQKVYPHIQIDRHRPDTQLQFSVWDTRYEYQKWRSSITRLGGDFKSPSLVVGGTGSRGVVGSRVTGVLAFDDVSDIENSGTEELRLQLWRWITDVVLPILTGKHYRVWSIGTRWAEGDVVSRQIETGEYNWTEIKAIIRDEYGKLKSYWPSLYPFSVLIKILNTVAKTSFLLSYMNNITGLKGAIFTADMLRHDFPRDESGRPVFPEFDKIIVSVDAAIKAKEANDESTAAIIGIRRSPNTSLPQMWLLRIEVGHWGNMEVIERIEELWNVAINTFNADDYSVLIETVAGQQLFLTLMEQKPDFTVPMSLIDTYSPVTDKGTRARSTAAAGERGDLLVDTKAWWYQKWFSQCIEFTGAQGNADDLIDVMTQVGSREFGDILSYQSFNANSTLAVIPGLTMI